MFFGGNYFARGEFVLYINHSGNVFEIGVSGWRNNAFDHGLNSIKLNQYTSLLTMIHFHEKSVTQPITMAAHGTLEGEKICLSLLTIQITAFPSFSFLSNLHVNWQASYSSHTRILT